MIPVHPAQMDSARPWWQVRLVLALLALCVLLTLGHVPLIDEDEGEYSEVAAEMAASGHYFAPTLNGQAFYEKPALLFWLQAPLVHFLGPQEWVFRLPPLLATLTLLIGMMLGWRKRVGEKEALTSVWLASLTLGMTIAGRAATMDSLIMFWLSATLFDLWGYLESGERMRLRRAALWAALGFLTKGPMALVIPALVSMSFLIFTPGFRSRWTALYDPWAWGIFALVAGPWFVGYSVYSQGAFFHYFFLRENLGRVGGALQGHSGSLAYYFVVLPLLMLPYSAVLVRLIQRSRFYWQAPFNRFLMIWFVVVFVVFSLAGTKLPHYILYGCVPLFLLGASELLRPGGLWWRVGLALPGLFLPFLALALPVVAAHFVQTDPNPYIREMLSRGPEVFNDHYQFAVIAWVVLSGLSAVALIFYVSPRIGHRYTVLIPGLLTAFGVSWILIPAVSGLQQVPVRDAALFARSLNLPVVSDNRMPSFSVYLGQATQRTPLKAGDIAFGRIDHPDQLGTQNQILFAKGGVRVVRVLQP